MWYIGPTRGNNSGKDLLVVLLKQAILEGCKPSIEAKLNPMLSNSPKHIETACCNSLIHIKVVFNVVHWS
jgi:hypothetical protein